MLGFRLQAHELDDVDHTHAQVGRCSPSSAAAASVSSVGTSPGQLSTTIASAWVTTLQQLVGGLLLRD
jgi:hypothetical protein